MLYRKPGTLMHCLGLLSKLTWITRLIQVILGRIMSSRDGSWGWRDARESWGRLGLDAGYLLCSSNRKWAHVSPGRTRGLGTSWRLWQIGIELILNLQNNLVEWETWKRLEERDQAIYEDRASLDQRLDRHRRHINCQASRVSWDCSSLKSDWSGILDIGRHQETGESNHKPSREGLPLWGKFWGVFFFGR